MVTSSPTDGIWWLAFVGWVPWLYAIEGVSPRRAFFYGWFTGTLTVFWGFVWLTALLTRFAGFPPNPAYGIHLIFAAFQGLQWAVPAAVIVWLRQRTGRDVLLIAPLAWTAGEALLPHVFPSYMALAWCFQPLWLQTAEIGGVTTVGFVQLTINASLYVVLRELLRGRGLHKRAALVFAATMIITPLYGAIRMAQVDAVIERAPKVKIGVVQGNFGITQWSSPRHKPLILSALQLESAKREREGAELLLWGETAYPFSRAIARDGSGDLPLEHRWRIRREFTKPLIFGVVTFDRRVSKYAFNSAMVLREDGSTGEVYDKNFPLYFGEYIPLIDPDWYLKHVPSASYINPGQRPVPLTVGDYRFGPLICYEDILPRFARETARVGVHAFVNMTNDSWFGKTKEQYQHMGLAVLRTIENRRALLRAVNAGVSVYIDPNGRVLQQTEVTDPDAERKMLPADGFVAEVPMIAPEDYTTLYTRTGELFNGLVLLGLILIGRRRRERPASG
jgi:apolipoprotein N-acyltransferase